MVGSGIEPVNPPMGRNSLPLAAVKIDATAEVYTAMTYGDPPWSFSKIGRIADDAFPDESPPSTLYIAVVRFDSNGEFMYP
jgi:hypothetical protein